MNTSIRYTIGLTLVVVALVEWLFGTPDTLTVVWLVGGVLWTIIWSTIEANRRFRERQSQENLVQRVVKADRN